MDCTSNKLVQPDLSSNSQHHADNLIDDKIDKCQHRQPLKGHEVPLLNSAGPETFDLLRQQQITSLRSQIASNFFDLVNHVRSSPRRTYGSLVQEQRRSAVVAEDEYDQRVSDPQSNQCSETQTNERGTADFKSEPGFLAAQIEHV